MQSGLSQPRSAPGGCRSSSGSTGIPASYHGHFVPVHLDLSAAPSCPAPGSPLRAELRSAALYALEQAPVMTADQISAVLTFTDACEVTALSLLDEPARPYARAVGRAGLVLAFAECDHVDQESRKGHAHTRRQPGRAGIRPRHCRRRCPPCRRRSGSPTSSLPWWPRVDLGDEVNQAVLAWAEEPWLPTDAWRDAMQAMAPHDRASLPILAQLAQLADHGIPCRWRRRRSAALGASR